MNVRILLSLGVLLALVPSSPGQVRIKDITDLDGVRSNQLLGFGLVVGLDGTGGRVSATQQAAVEIVELHDILAMEFRVIDPS